MERTELEGECYFPLNIQGNKRPELVAFVLHLKATRSAYTRRFVQSSIQPTSP